MGVTGGLTSESSLEDTPGCGRLARSQATGFRPGELQMHGDWSLQPAGSAPPLFLPRWSACRRGESGRMPGRRRVMVSLIMAVIVTMIMPPLHCSHCFITGWHPPGAGFSSPRHRGSANRRPEPINQPCCPRVTRMPAASIAPPSCFEAEPIGENRV